MYKIKKITKQVPKEETLPNGNYAGKWGGYVITINYKGIAYECKTEEGVRGINIPVVVNVKDGKATFEELNN